MLQLDKQQQTLCVVCSPTCVNIITVAAHTTSLLAVKVGTAPIVQMMITITVSTYDKLTIRFADNVLHLEVFLVGSKDKSL